MGSKLSDHRREIDIRLYALIATCLRQNIRGPGAGLSQWREESTGSRRRWRASSPVLEPELSRGARRHAARPPVRMYGWDPQRRGGSRRSVSDPRVSVLIKRFLASKGDWPLGGRLRGRRAFA